MIRWLVFPALAALGGAGAGAGVAAALGYSLGDVLEFAALASPMALAGALAFAQPGPNWSVPLVAPVLGGLVFCGGFSAFSRARGNGLYADPWQVGRQLFSYQWEWMIVIAVFSSALALAHRLRRRGFRRGVLAAAGAALVMAFSGCICFRGRDAASLAALGPALALLNSLALELAIRADAGRSKAFRLTES